MKKLTRNILIASLACFFFLSLSTLCSAVSITDVKSGEDIFKYIERIKGKFDQTLYRQIIGAANAFKEGDEAISVAADNEKSRGNARKLLANTKIKDLHEHPLLADTLQKFIWDTTDNAAYEKIKGWTMGELKNFILTKSESEIKGIMGGLNSEIIGCVPKLMSNKELISVGQKIFNPLPGSKIGAKGYMGARIQPNSPTDDPDDIQWQTFNAFSFAVGDVVLGTNPVDGSKEACAKIQRALRDVIVTFKLEDTLPWCVLSHVDVQSTVRKDNPELVDFLFQSLAGTDDANKTFDVSVVKMIDHAKSRAGQKYGLYYETGQGSDFTNGAANGVDMAVLESRKYGFARGLKQELAKVQSNGAWTHFNDVAGFIGPEVFRTREQLVRCCLEDITMGKLHGLAAGLDICSTLHMPVTLDDLDWCIDQIMPANPAYLMALPTKNDPMLSYLTTGYQDHVRLRNKFGYKVNDAMWDFFKKIQIIDKNGKYTEHAGDPIWVYYQFCLAKGDKRSKDEIYAEGQKKINEVQGRAVDLAIGHGKNVADMNPALKKRLYGLYEDAKKCLWSEFTPDFIKTIPNPIQIATMSKDREDYVAHPPTGEKLNEQAVASLEKLRDSWGGKDPDVQIVVSDGLSGNAIMDSGHLAPYLNEVKKELKNAGYTVDEKTIVVTNGRVRAGYEIGNVLFGKSDPAKPKAVLNIIGERPGTEHHSFSVYIAAPKADVWAEKKCDHDIVKVVCNIADTALKPELAAKETVRLLKGMTEKI